MNKKILVPTLSLALLGAVVLTGTSQVRTAQAQDNESEGNYPSLIQRLVERFNLNDNEVETVFNEHRAERHKQRAEHHEEMLNQAVEEGKLTEDQKNALLSKHEEMRGDMEEYKNMTREEHMEMREEHRAEMDQWAEENGIELDHFNRDQFERGEKGERGERMGQGYGIHRN